MESLVASRAWPDEVLPFALWDPTDALCPPRLASPEDLTHSKIKGFLISLSQFIHSLPVF